MSEDKFMHSYPEGYEDMYELMHWIKKEKENIEDLREDTYDGPKYIRLEGEKRALSNVMDRIKEMMERADEEKVILDKKRIGNELENRGFASEFVENLKKSIDDYNNGDVVEKSVEELKNQVDGGQNG